MELNYRVLTLAEMDEITEFERENFSRSGFSQPEQMILSWKAPWRRESLEHYLGRGWCFGARDKFGKMVGYFLAQPILFFAD